MSLITGNCFACSFDLLVADQHAKKFSLGNVHYHTVTTTPNGMRTE